eukprot:578502-Prymnesium_polylepis.1
MNLLPLHPKLQVLRAWVGQAWGGLAELFSLGGAASRRPSMKFQFRAKFGKREISTKKSQPRKFVEIWHFPTFVAGVWLWCTVKGV